MPVTLGIPSPTATSPATTRTAIAPQVTNYGADFRVVSEKPGEVILSNINADRATPEVIRIAWSEVADVFKGSKVTPTARAIKSGTSVLVQLNAVMQYIDDAGINIDNYPIGAHLVLKVPSGVAVNYEFIIVMIQTLLGSLHETGDATPHDRVEALLRGILKPKDL